MRNRILIRHNKNWGLDEDLVKNILTNILLKKKLRDTEISVYFVGRKKAKDLNVKYRQMSYIPQVLGFPMNRTRDADGVIRLGDIVICTQKLKSEVGFQKSNLKDVLENWLNHGLSNLLI